MAKDIVPRSKSTAVAEAPERNWAEEYGDEAFTTNIIGQLLKFNKGEWLVGQEEEEMPIGTELVAATHLLQSGWMRWEDGKPVETIMGLRSEGFKPPPRESLGHTDKSEWGELNGQVIDPWRRADVLLMADPKTGQVYTFSPMSDGGLQAIKKLMREYGPHMRVAPDEIPTVRLGSSWYKHPKYSKVYKPELELVEDGWRDVNDVSFEPVDEDVEEAAPAPKAKAAATPKPAPRSAPKAKAPKAPPPTRRGNSQGARTRY
jgi:hypothetical protein